MVKRVFFPPPPWPPAWLHAPVLRELFAAITHAGGEARVVGGALRNSLLGQEVSDIDLAITLAPTQAESALQLAGFKTYPTGLAHGTITALKNGQSFEVTSLRRDLATDGRHAAVVFTQDWALDSARRDFTMNSLYCDENGKIYDYTNGYEDILKRCVKFVGDPAQRIAEDYLRILRFFRFFAAYGQGPIDGAGFAAAVAGRAGMATLSPERIRDELFKLVVAPQAVASLELMRQGDILVGALRLTAAIAQLAFLPHDPVLRLVALVAVPDQLARALHLSRLQQARIALLGRMPPLSPQLNLPTLHKLLYQQGAQAFQDAAHLCYAQHMTDNPLALSTRKAWQALIALPDHWPIPVFPVKGQDLLEAGYKPGPRVGQELRQLEDAWIASDFTATKDQLLCLLD